MRVGRGPVILGAEEAQVSNGEDGKAGKYGRLTGGPCALLAEDDELAAQGERVRG